MFALLKICYISTIFGTWSKFEIRHADSDFYSAAPTAHPTYITHRPSSRPVVLPKWGTGLLRCRKFQNLPDFPFSSLHIPHKVQLSNQGGIAVPTHPITWLLITYFSIFTELLRFQPCQIDQRWINYGIYVTTPPTLGSPLPSKT